MIAALYPVQQKLFPIHVTIRSIQKRKLKIIQRNAIIIRETSYNFFFKNIPGWPRTRPKLPLSAKIWRPRAKGVFQQRISDKTLSKHLEHEKIRVCKTPYARGVLGFSEPVCC